MSEYAEYSNQYSNIFTLEYHVFHAVLFPSVRLFLREDLTENSNNDIKGGTSVPKS